jgi:hypothetical protein
MAAEMIPVGKLSDVSCAVATLPANSIAEAHVEWSRQFVRFCVDELRTARRLGLPEDGWRRALYFGRMALAQWRKRAERLAPVLVCLVWFIAGGCAKAPARDVPLREFTTNFEVQPAPDGQSIVWSLQFRSRAQYHAFIESTQDGAERAKIRELIAAGMRLHHIVGCSAREKAVTKLDNDGIAFVGSCQSNPAHAMPAGGI